MSGIDLTDEIMKPAEDVAVGYGIATEGDAINLAWDVVKASLPLIEAAVRAQIAAEIEALVHMAIGDAYLAIMRAAKVARGDS